MVVKSEKILRHVAQFSEHLKQQIVGCLKNGAVQRKVDVPLHGVDHRHLGGGAVVVQLVAPVLL